MRSGWPPGTHVSYSPSTRTGCSATWSWACHSTISSLSSWETPDGLWSKLSELFVTSFRMADWDDLESFDVNALGLAPEEDRRPIDDHDGAERFQIIVAGSVAILTESTTSIAGFSEPFRADTLRAAGANRGA